MNPSPRPSVVDAGDAVLLFELGAVGQRTELEAVFGLEVREVQRVISSAGVQGVPFAPPAVRGIVNHQGRIITIVDPAPLLGMQAQSDASEQAVLLRRAGRAAGNVGLRVRRIREVVSRAHLLETSHEDALNRLSAQDSERLARQLAEPMRCSRWGAVFQRRVVRVLDGEAIMRELRAHFEALTAQRRMGIGAAGPGLWVLGRGSLSGRRADGAGSDVDPPPSSGGVAGETGGFGGEREAGAKERAHEQD